MAIHPSPTSTGRPVAVLAAAGRRPSAPGRRHHRQPAVRQLDHLAAGMRRRVERHPTGPATVPRADQDGLGFGGHPVGHSEHLGVVAAGVVVDPLDAGTGQDVVELLEEQQLPGLVQQLPAIEARLRRTTSRPPAAPPRPAGWPA